jgi:prepilin-type N-terminal cleavage/methylation domain-containing protein
VFHNLFERYGEIQSRRNDEKATEQGFTLIELLIVIVVLGILAAIVIFSLSGVTGQSASAACTSDAKTVETAVAAYNAQTGANPDAVTVTAGVPGGAGLNELVPGYLRSWPAAGGSAKYTISYTGGTNGQVQVAIGTGAAANYDNGGACTGA